MLVDLQLLCSQTATIQGKGEISFLGKVVNFQQLFFLRNAFYFEIIKDSQKLQNQYVEGIYTHDLLTVPSYQTTMCYQNQPIGIGAINQTSNFIKQYFNTCEEGRKVLHNEEAALSSGQIIMKCVILTKSEKDITKWIMFATLQVKE